MRILLAPDSFKGSLSAVEFCRIAEQLIQQHWPQIDVISRPLADGGEGFIDAIVYSGLAQRRTADSVDPLGRLIQADFAWQPTTRTAFIEMAQASGLPLLAPNERNPRLTSTFGTGLVIQAALNLGAQNIVVGLGGSATNDGGAGALQALGVELLNAQSQPISLGASGLTHLSHIANIPDRLKQINWRLACDVNNPLLGEQGATAIYGPQKGVNAENLAELEQALTIFAHRIQQRSGQDISTRPGGGAAGGMAAGFIGLLNATTESGFDLLAQATDFDALFEHKIDWVITGEGKMDAQTLHGKLPMRVAQRAAQHKVPTLAICGQVEPSSSAAHPEFTAIYSLVNTTTTEQQAMQQPALILQQRLYQALNNLIPNGI